MTQSRRCWRSTPKKPVSKTGERVAGDEFYPGFRKTVIRPDELPREIRVPALNNNQRGRFSSRPVPRLRSRLST